MGDLDQKFSIRRAPPTELLDVDEVEINKLTRIIGKF